MPEIDDNPSTERSQKITAACELGSAEANRLFYEGHAATYDESEFCAIAEGPRETLRALLERALALVPASDPAVLDAGGGTGHASLMLHEIGIASTLIDTSPEMIARYEEKARARGHEPRSEIGDLESLFVADERRWDLIVFSSVLHHLEDPVSVLAAAAGRLEPGGVIVTIFDPLAVDRIGHLLRRLDYGCWIAVHSPASFARAVGRRLRPRRPSQGTELNIAAVAERHAMSGLDDERIRSRVEAAGLLTREHERFYDARYRWIIAASRGLGKATHFSFVFQSPTAD